MTMTENDDDTVDNHTHTFKCIKCGNTDGMILAAVWADDCGPFDLPIGYGCMDCYPNLFDHWMVEQINELKKEEG